MKRYKTLIGTFVVLVGLFAGVTGVAQAATADITLNSVGSRNINTDIQIKGYLSGDTAGSQMVVATQRNDSGTWTTLETKTFTALGAYTMTPQRVATAGTWQFRTTVTVGGTLLDTSDPISVIVKSSGSNPPPPPPATNTVTVAGQNRTLTGTNITRTTNALVMYTPAYGARTGTNQYGYEAAVVNGVVTQAQNGVGNMTIPSNGYVLSGHGTERTWLASVATVGATVALGGTNPTDPPGRPAPVTETRSGVVSANCQTLQVTVSNQTRTNTWQWNGTAWVDNWSAWTSTGTTSTRTATSAECVNEVTTLSSDVLLPDIRIKNLDKCGAGDMQATGGKCFLIRNPNPSNPDFPALNGIKFLKFPVITLNAGAGPAEVIAERSSTTGTWKAWQTFYRPNGERQSQVAPNVEFYYAGDGHNHWHFKDFDYYWIESLSGTVLRTAEKHGYCLEDNTTWNGLSGQPGVPTSPVYQNATTCGQGLPNTLNLIEGLSRGWGDTYTTNLPDQGINITGLPDGRYRVGITADAIGAVRESNENNNTASMEISISGNTVTTYPATATGGLA